MKIALYSFLLMNLTWIYYIAIMHLRDAKDAGRLSGFAKYLGYSNLAIGLVLDVLVNLVPVTILLLEVPRIFDGELLTTTRLSRHIKEGDGWRRSVALWCCKNLLSTFDSDHNHCGE